MSCIYKNSLRKIISIILSFLIGWGTGPSYAQIPALILSEPGTRISLTPAVSPVYLRGLIANPKDPFQLQFLVEQGDQTLDKETGQIFLDLFNHS